MEAELDEVKRRISQAYAALEKAEADDKQELILKINDRLNILLADKARLEARLAPPPVGATGAGGPAAPRLNPIDNLIALLEGSGISLDEECAFVIQRHYGDWLRGCVTQESAVELVQTAGRHYHMSTQARIAKNHQILLNGILPQNDSSSAELYRAVLLTDSTPKVVKFGESIGREYQVFRQLGLSPEECIQRHIVPVEMAIFDDNGKTGLVLPMFALSLSSVNSDGKADSELLENCIFKGITQILLALESFHSKNIRHNDIKPSNIFIDFKGGWFLGDFGSCYFEGLDSKMINYTASFAPIDLLKNRIRRNTPGYDKLLLLITALVVLGRLDISHSFTMQNVLDGIEAVTSMDLRQLLQSLLS